MPVLLDTPRRLATEYEERRGSATLERLSKAVRLDQGFYRSVADDPARTREAVIVAAVSALVMSLGLMLMRIIDPLSWLLGALAWAAVVLFGGAWFLVAVGGRMGGQATYHQMLRPLGYAMVPQALGFVPLGNFVPGFLIGGIWSAACAVIAVKEAHRVPTRLAAALVIAPLLMIIAIGPLVGVVLTGGG